MTAPRKEAIESEVRRRLAEALTGQGVGFSRVSLEVLYLLPPEFVEAYVKLFYSAFKDGAAMNVGDPHAEPVKVRRSGVKAGAGVAKTGRRYRDHWHIRDEGAFERKQRIDKELRKMVGRMLSGSGDDGRERSRCGGCGRWVERKWRYCAWCGEGVNGAG